jgi:TatD DNase family protein
MKLVKCAVPVNVQQEVFVRQMKGAISVGKPLVVHSRDASADTLRLMTETLPGDWKIHLHCFTGDDDEFAQNMLRAFPNLNIGFTGAITFKSAQKTRDIVARVPLDRILLETDGNHVTLF